MEDRVDEKEAIEIAKEYADEECVGELGEISDTKKQDNSWIVEFRTHTFSDSHDHRVRITVQVGNIVSHERDDRFD